MTNSTSSLNGSSKILAAFTIIILLLSTLLTGYKEEFEPDGYSEDFEFLWRSIKNNYAYFDKKKTDWERVKQIYSPLVKNVKTRDEFISFLEKVLDEIYDDHASLNTNLANSPRLVPSGLDLWAEWSNGKGVITELRRGFSAEQSGMKVGMEILRINNIPVKDAMAKRIGRSLREIDEEVNNWALRAVLAGTHDKPRTIEARGINGNTSLFRLDLPAHLTVDNFEDVPKVDWKILRENIGYIKIHDLIANVTVEQFDSALEKVKNTRGLILDLRDLPKGGNTDVAEPILGRFIDKKMGYQEVVPMDKPKYIKEVKPNGPWIYKAPLVVLVNHWTASMGEGMTIGLDGMKRGKAVGTKMAGLNGGITSLALPRTGIKVNYPFEKLNHIDGSPRENFYPPVLVGLSAFLKSSSNDPIFETGREELLKIIKN